MATPGGPVPSTPDATASVAQTLDGAPAAAREPVAATPDEGLEAFVVSPQVARHASRRAYQRKRDDPVYRPLRIFALDPGVSKLHGAIALVNVPYEPLKPGPAGRIFRIDPVDPVCDLESPTVLLQQGYAPSRSDRRFHHQMLYAVCSSVYASFRAALGREPVWGFVRAGGDEDWIKPGVLLVRPQAFIGRNAYYDKSDGSLNFGSFTAEHTTPGLMKGEVVYTCLSHDVISHELTHALLDGLREHFTIPTRIDVLAFHEAFADIVAVLQHFTYRDVVLAAIRKSRGKITDGLLTDLARPLGRSLGRPSALRSAVEGIRDDGTVEVRRYDAALPAHELGAVLLAAVFDAFNTVYERKTTRYVRLATGGTGQLPMGELPSLLQEMLAEEASRLASQFLSICIRAIDYCPPVDLEFGEFLRAVITADRELVPDDPWAYREAWIDAFRERGILPSRVKSLDEEALLWNAPETLIAPVPELSFGRLRFRGDPGHAAGARELKRQATALGTIVSQRAYTESFGLLPVGVRGACPPKINSIRSARRVGPDGQIVFDVVADVTQHCVVPLKSGRRTVAYGGSTVILGPNGDVRYIIGKGVVSESRIDALSEFVESQAGMAYWHEHDGVTHPTADVLKMLHESGG